MRSEWYPVCYLHISLRILDENDGPTTHKDRFYVSVCQILVLENDGRTADSVKVRHMGGQFTGNSWERKGIFYITKGVQ